MSSLPNPPAAQPTTTGPAITLANDGSRWTCTSATDLGSFIDGLLRDGEGFTAAVTTAHDFTHTGEVYALDDEGYIAMAAGDDRLSLAAENIVRIDVL